MEQRELTVKEKQVVQEYEKHGVGDAAKQNILNPNSGWAEIIAETPAEELKVGTGHNSNNGFCYEHIH
ncbi:MAG: hypothetical protein F6J89_15955 [Symploca sp. SIO1C4]|uniref:Uncharacterized protein n=1 Tax=Symploca sp. SIO1C4 TaxID=2607765 RepID=A0A6B3NHG0_9CYAN|nr:hypothetical protein [Symploca sp. SIO1C4]